MRTPSNVELAIDEYRVRQMEKPHASHLAKYDIRIRQESRRLALGWDHDEMRRWMKLARNIVEESNQ